MDASAALDRDGLFEDDDEDFGLQQPQNAATEEKGAGFEDNIDLYGDIAGEGDIYDALYGEQALPKQEGHPAQELAEADPASETQDKTSSAEGTKPGANVAAPSEDASRQRSAPASSRGSPSQGSSSAIYIANLQWWTTDAEVEALCSPFGTVEGLRFFEDRHNGKSKGYVLVTFDTVQAAHDCREALDGREIDGKKCIVTFAKQKEQAAGGRGEAHAPSTSGRGLSGRGGRGEYGGRGTRPQGNAPYRGHGRGRMGGPMPGQGLGPGRGPGMPFMPPGMGMSGGGGPFMPPGMGPRGIGGPMGGPMNGHGMPFMPPGFMPGMPPNAPMGGMPYGQRGIVNKRPRY